MIENLKMTLAKVQNLTTFFKQCQLHLKKFIANFKTNLISLEFHTD
jgi:hypothetical protein